MTTWKKLQLKAGVLYWNKEIGQQLLSTKDKTGYGGRIFNLKMDDGSIESITGPWSSSPNIVRMYADPTFVGYNERILKCSNCKEKTIHSKTGRVYGYLGHYQFQHYDIKCQKCSQSFKKTAKYCEKYFDNRGYVSAFEFFDDSVTYT
jgi:hypothetical protein